MITNVIRMCIPLLALVCSVPGAHATTPKDVSVVARAFGFVEPPLSGPIGIAVIYDPAISGSQTEAELIVAALQKAKLKGLTLSPAAVPVSDAKRQNAARIAFLTTGLGRHHDTLFDRLSARKILTVSGDMSCVDAGKCVIGVRSRPQVEIVVSRAARQSSRIGFGQAFLMLVNEQ